MPQQAFYIFRVCIKNAAQKYYMHDWGIDLIIDVYLPSIHLIADDKSRLQLISQSLF